MQIVIDDILLNYSFINRKKQSTIVILHGWGRTYKEWVPIGERLSQDYNILFLDLPGFGGSSIPENEHFGMNQYQATVEKFIKKMKLKNLTLIGHSFGGKISIMIASKLDRVEHLILINSSGVDEKNMVTNLKIWLARKLKPLTFFLSENSRETLLKTLASSDYPGTEQFRKIFKSIINRDVVKEAKIIKCKTLIVWGEKDKEVSISSTKKIKTLISGSILRIVWGAGHDPHLTHPEKLLLLLKEYL